MITQAQLLQMEARLSSNRRKADYIHECEGAPVEREHDLHDQIADYCRLQGYLLLTSRFGVKSTIPAGWADATIFMPNAKVCFLELKKRGGKATKKQNETIAYARKLGFVAEIVESLGGAIHFIRKAQE